MVNLNCEGLPSNCRQTRWDEIKRKYTANGGETVLNSPIIRHLMEIDFIGRTNCRLLISDDDTKRCLNPFLVMNLRHEMLRQIPKKLSKKIPSRSKSVASCTVHNRTVENYYLNKQLQNCKEQLSKEYKRFRIQPSRLEYILNENSVIKRCLDLRRQYIFNCCTELINDGNKLHQEANEMIKINMKLDNINALNLLWHGEAIPIKIKPKFSQKKKKRMLPADELIVFDEIINSRNRKNNSTEYFGNFFVAHCHQLFSGKKISKSFALRVPAPKSILSFLELGIEIEIPNLLKIQTNQIKSNDHLLLEQSEGFLSLNYNISNEICEIGPSENAKANEHFFKYTDSLISNRNEQLWSNSKKIVEEIMQTLVEIDAKELYPLLCSVCFHSEVRINRFYKENLSYAVNCNGLNSIISKLNEALTKLQIEGRTSTVMNNNKYNQSNNHVLQKHGTEVGTNLILRECLIEYSYNGKTAHSTKYIKNIKLCIDHFEKNDESNEQIQTSALLFQRGLRSNDDTLHKYFFKWFNYINIEKIQRECTNDSIDREKKINIFLNKVRKQKELLQTNGSNLNCFTKEGNITKHGKFYNNIKFSKIYQNKIKIQQDIIEFQKMNLERQKRLILEFKIGKFSENTNTFRQHLKDELKNILPTGNSKAKAKAKCLRFISNLRDEKDEKIESLKGKSLLPTFFQRIQQRALERSVKHEQIKQKRLRIEAEREAQKLAQEELKRLEDEKSRRNRIAVLRKNREKEKLEKIRKAEDRQLAIDNFNKAALFYRHLLLKRLGMKGFKRLLKRKKNIEIKCKQLSHSICQKHYIHAWVIFYYISKARRNQKANNFYKQILKRLYLQKWLKYIEGEKSKMNVAIDWHEWKFAEHVFKKWLSYTRQMLLIVEMRSKQATSHYEWHTKWKVLDRWQYLSQILRIEKETVERRQKWRTKIWELLPDYKPNRNELD